MKDLTLFIMSISVLVGLFILIGHKTHEQSTVQCTEGKLYDVSYEGNITIYEKRPFTECEETK